MNRASAKLIREGGKVALVGKFKNGDTKSATLVDGTRWFAYINGRDAKSFQVTANDGKVKFSSDIGTEDDNRTLLEKVKGYEETGSRYEVPTVCVLYAVDEENQRLYMIGITDDKQTAQGLNMDRLYGMATANLDDKRTGTLKYCELLVPIYGSEERGEEK